MCVKLAQVDDLEKTVGDFRGVLAIQVSRKAVSQSEIDTYI